MIYLRHLKYHIEYNVFYEHIYFSKKKKIVNIFFSFFNGILTYEFVLNFIHIMVSS